MKIKKGATITAVPFIFSGSLMRVAIATPLFYDDLTRLSIEKSKGATQSKRRPLAVEAVTRYFYS